MLGKATKALETDDPRWAVRMVTPAEAQAVLDAMEGRDVHCTASEAATHAGQLVNCYPAREVNDARTYIAAMTAMMAAFPRDFVKRVCDPVNGLPSRLKFLPALAEVREALDLEANRRKLIEANARYVLEQAAKRDAEALEQARWDAQRVPPEERARQVQVLLRGVVGDTTTEAGA